MQADRSSTHKYGRCARCADGSTPVLPVPSTIRLLFLSCLLALASSCHSTKGTKYRFPDDLRGMAHAQMAVARACIEQQNVALAEKAKVVTLEKVPGTRRFPEGWGWYVQDLGTWAVELTRMTSSGWVTVQVGCNPATGQEVDPDPVKHGFGHMWLFSNYDLGGHDPRYRGCFENWTDTRVRILSTAGGDLVVICSPAAVDAYPD